MADTIKASVITDHAFEPREYAVVVGVVNPTRLPPNVVLCQICRLGEAAHRETTVKR